MTRSTTTYDSGAVILVRIAFTNLSGAKVRPALVLSTPPYAQQFGDLIVMPLTSQPQSDSRLALDRWRGAGLLKATWVKPLIASVASAEVVRALGQIDPVDVPVVRHVLRTIVDARWLA